MCKKIISFVMALATCAAALVSCSFDRRERFQSAFADVFDTVTELTVYCNSKKDFDVISKQAHDELVRLHHLFDIYNSYEGVLNLCALNAADKSSPVEVPAEIAQLVKLGKEMYSSSDKALNVGMGAVLSVWHTCREKGDSVPEYSALCEKYKHCNLDTLTLEGNVLTFADTELKLDFGAIAKGYAADKIAALLKEKGYNDFALNLGGNVITSGTKLGKSWKIGIENPDGGVLEALSVSDVSVVTSGDYQRYYVYEGKKYHHIIDPATLFPSEYYRSVTVVGENSAYADALSTALFCLPLECGRELAEKYGAEALWITADGEIIKSDGFEKYEK